MTKKVRLLLSFGPELDGVRQSIQNLPMTTNERATKVDMLQIVLLSMEVGNLTDVVAIWISYSQLDIFESARAFT